MDFKESLKHGKKQREKGVKPKTPKPEPEIKKDQLVLPFVYENERGVPNAVLRSALFGVVKRGKRAKIEHEINCSKSNTIFFAGEQLDQADLDVWEQCLFLQEGASTSIQFTAYSFLKSIGKRTCKQDYEWLERGLDRILSARVKIQDKRFSYNGGFISSYTRDDETKMYRVNLDPDLSKMFQKYTWTKLDNEQRQLLFKNQLAQWLHAFYSTHAQPFAYKLETIQELCGSQTKELRKFKQQLAKSYRQVSAVTGWRFGITKDNLLVVTKPKGTLSTLNF